MIKNNLEKLLEFRKEFLVDNIQFLQSIANAHNDSSMYEKEILTTKCILIHFDDFFKIDVEE